MCRTLVFVFFNGAPQFERSTNQETLSFLRVFFYALVILAAVSIADINMAAGTKVADSLLTAVTPQAGVQLALKYHVGATMKASELTSYLLH